MKTKSILVGLAMVTLNCYGQQSQTFTNSLNQKVEVIQCSDFKITKPLREMAGQTVIEKKNETKESSNKYHYFPSTYPNALPNGDDPVWQKDGGNMQGRAPIQNFEGLNEPAVSPLDPSGAASATHYVQAINSKYRVFDKTGTGLSNEFNLSNIFTGSSDCGDPIVMYDKYADRWVITEFDFDCLIGGSGPYILMVAVSQSNDPLGSYYTYSFTMTDLPDYPKYSIWWDGYYFSINSNQGTSGVMDRTKMLAGDNTATLQILTAPLYSSSGFTSLLPADADGSLPPNGSPNYFFNLQDDGWFGDPDAIQVYKMTTDWTTPSNTSIVLDNTISVSAFDSDFSTPPGQYLQISQKGTTDKIDAVAGVFYYRAQHTVWTNHNSMVLCHVVDVDGNDRAGMRWYELRQTSGGQWSLYQEGTYAPTSDTDNRWMGSIAMDNQGNIGMAYSVSGPNTYPSIRYTGRLATDPLGQMTMVEETAIAGTGSQTSTTGGDRYGDYSHLALDPDGTTFWHTAQYVKTDGLPRTRIYSFEVASNVGLQGNMYYSNIETKVLNNSEFITLNVAGLYNNDALSFDVFDASGKLIYHKDITPNDNGFNQSVSTSEFANGVYLFRFGNSNFQVVNKINIGK